MPTGEDPRSHPELRAGTFSTFGLAETSRSNDQHDAEGLTAVFEITALRDRLTDADRWDDARVDGQLQHRGARRLDAGGPCPQRGGAARTRPAARRVAIVVD